jgi:hypothetical protein
MLMPRKTADESETPERNSTPLQENEKQRSRAMKAKDEKRSGKDPDEEVDEEDEDDVTDTVVPEKKR